MFGNILGTKKYSIGDSSLYGGEKYKYEHNNK